MTSFERRLVKLESHIAASNKAVADDEIETLVKFLTDHEMEDLMRTWGELGEKLTLQQLSTHAAPKEIIARSNTRRDRYPLLWLAWGLDEGQPAAAYSWSAETEIEVLRNKVAISWKRKGLALDLDALSADDLTIVNDLRANLHSKLGSWDSVRYVATPSEIEPVIARVWLAARATNRHEIDRFGIPAAWEPAAWENVGRPLTWPDLELSPATFPWPARRQWEQRTERDSSWWRDGQKNLGVYVSHGVRQK